MKQLLILITLLMTSIQFSAQPIDKEQSETSCHLEEEAIKNIMETSFLNGALNELNVERLADACHPDFAILIANGENLYRLELPAWINVIEQYKASPERMESGDRNVDYKLERVDITGNTAVVKVRLFRQGQLIITDYVSFLKFKNGWKAVSKVSNEHIPNPLNI